jgi:hypothetical protein
VTNSPVPQALLDAVRSDLKPVQALPMPRYRALKLLPVGAAVLIGIPEFWTWRLHSSAASWPAWLISVCEIGFSLLIVTASFREAIPGRELSLKRIAVLLCLACLVFMLANPVLSPPSSVALSITARWIGECLSRAMMFSIPALVLAIVLASRGLPNRPALVGALCGLGVGFMGDAGLRLLCWDGDFSHVVLAHGGAIAVLACLGSLVSFVVERIKRERELPSPPH